MQASAEDRLPDDELIAQMSYAHYCLNLLLITSNLGVSTLTTAGTDTTSNGIARILHLLCIHQDVQDKLRKEILEAQIVAGKQDIDYDDLVDMPFLDAVCRETLRLYGFILALSIVTGLTKRQLFTRVLHYARVSGHISREIVNSANGLNFLQSLTRHGASAGPTPHMCRRQQHHFADRSEGYQYHHRGIFIQPK